MPVTWQALPRTSGANAFTVLTMKKPPQADAWADIGKIKQKLPEPAKRRR
jgi:DNA primase